MDRMAYTQAVVRIRVLEKRLLTKAQFNLLIEAKDLEEVFRLLDETEYSKSLSQISRKEDYEEVLGKELKSVYATAKEISPNHEIIDLLALKYDYHNLKVLLKEKFLNKDFSHLYAPVGSQDYQKVKKAYLEGDLRRLHFDFWEAISSAQEDFLQTKDPQRIDIILDRFYMNHLYEMAEKTGIDMFLEYVKALIDFTNIRSILRLQKMEKDIRFSEDVILPNGNIDKDKIVYSLHDSVDSLIELFRNENIHKFLIKGLKSYQETKRLTDFEKCMDDYLLDVCRKAKSIHFGPEPIFTYIVAKETEIKNLRIIIVSKLNNISPEATRERVRDLYA